MAPTVKLIGLEKAMKNLNKELKNIEGVTVGGLYAGGLIIQAEAQKRVPVEYGDLRASAYTRKAEDDPNAVEVGFNSAHAVYVHENLQQKLKGKRRQSGIGVYWGPNGQPRFLSTAADETKEEVKQAVINHIQNRRSVVE